LAFIDQRKINITHLSIRIQVETIPKEPLRAGSFEQFIPSKTVVDR